MSLSSISEDHHPYLGLERRQRNKKTESKNNVDKRGYEPMKVFMKRLKEEKENSDHGME